MSHVSEETLADLLERLDRERQEADARYNAALTALDRVCEGRPEIPEPPPAVDTGNLAVAKSAWDTLPAHAGGGLKNLVRRVLWKLVGPPIHQQRHFNAAVVNHLTRLAADREAEQQTLARVLAILGDEADQRVRFQSHLIQYLQTVTLYVDTRDRSAGGGSMALNAGLSALADEWMKRWESLAAREERIAGRMASVSASLADLRAAVVLAQQTSISLKREVERVVSPVQESVSEQTGVAPGQASKRVVPDLDAFKYLGFENAFRGTPEEIRHRLAEYVPKFVGQSEVLDVGCGRGEFLQLLGERGIRARGLDLNQSMVEEARARGLDAIRADALAYLLEQDDASLGGVFAAQVVEHLDPGYLSKLIEAAAHKIRPGGVLVFETINPTCWVAFFESFIRDPTHVQPLHPETLQFMLRASGFGGVEVEYKAPVPATARLQAISNVAPTARPELAGIVDVINQNAALLNGRLFGYQDYAVVGRK